MKRYLFIHGKNTALSRYEITSVFPHNVQEQTDAFSVVELETPMHQKVLDRLGGTMKIAEVFSEDPVSFLVENSKNHKIVFGLSLYGGHERLSSVLGQIKDELKQQGRNARFMNKDFKNITSGQLNKSKLIQKGVDLVRCILQGKEYWGRTVVFQNIDDYSKRDFEKPKRDMKVGMMPPKLCQMMINFSGADNNTVIYDPFCGLGSTLMEAMLMGYQVLGSDIKGRLIDSTIKNLQWLEKESDVTVELPKGKALDKQFFQHDATQPFPSKKMPKKMNVVTESYLGPALLRFPHQEKQQEIFALLDGINQQFFENISQALPSKQRLVMCFPFFKKDNQRVFTPEENIRKYEAVGFSIQHELRQLLYERQNQVVGREIVVFQKN